MAQANYEIPDQLLQDVSCRECLYWLSPEIPAPMEDSERKKEWLSAVAAETGSVGKVAYVNGKAIAWVHYCLPKFLRKEAFAPHTPDPKALFICCLVVTEKYRGQGIGEKLLQAVIGEAERRGTAAVETIARSNSSSSPAGPAELYKKCGFIVKKEHPDLLLLRFEF